jgi:Winged helix DNA-binding domain
MTSLTWPQVNAWRLARHRLSPRRATPRGFERVAADICGIHAQMMSAAELQLAARVEGLTPRRIQDALWKGHSLIKTWAMRGTLHLFSAQDFPLYAAAFRIRDHWRRPSWLKAFDVSDAEMVAIIDGIGDVLGDGVARTREELAGEVASRVGAHAREKLLADSWGALLKPAASGGVLAFGPNRGRNVTFVRPDRWIEGWQDLEPGPSAGEILRRFVHMHGPTRAENFAHWWGLAQAPAKRVWRSVEKELAEVDVEGERAWVLAADATAIAGMEPDRSVRLVPNFDSYLLAYHPRSSMVRDRARELIFRPQGWISPVLLVGGEAAGVWELDRKPGRAVVRVEPFGRLPAGARKAAGEEAARIAAFLGLEPEVRFEPVTYLKAR